MTFLRFFRWKGGGNLALFDSQQEPWRIWETFTPHFEHSSVHRHSGYEFFLHVRGGGFYQLDDHVLHLQPYQLLVIRPHQPHGPVSHKPLVNFERLMLQVSVDVMSQIRLGGTSILTLVEQCCQEKPGQVLLLPQDYLHLSALAQMIPAAETLSTPAAQMEALGYMGVLLSRFCQAMTGSNRYQQGMIRDLLMQQIHDHILTHFMEDCSLDVLSEKFNISKFHLSRRFSETYGVGLHQYTMQCRMTYAQQLIRQGEPMMSISYQCGFNDYSSFVRAFTRHTGVNPRAWRKQQLQPASSYAL